MLRLQLLHWSLTFLQPEPHDTYRNEHCAQLRPLALIVAHPSIVIPELVCPFTMVVVEVVDPPWFWVFVLPQFVVDPWLYVDEPDDDELPDEDEDEEPDEDEDEPDDAAD